jgi:hypothetical protein
MKEHSRGRFAPTPAVPPDSRFSTSTRYLCISASYFVNAHLLKHRNRIKLFHGRFSAFKAKVALEATKGEKTIAQLSNPVNSDNTDTNTGIAPYAP